MSLKLHLYTTNKILVQTKIIPVVTLQAHFKKAFVLTRKTDRDRILWLPDEFSTLFLKEKKSAPLLFVWRKTFEHWQFIEHWVFCWKSSKIFFPVSWTGRDPLMWLVQNGADKEESQNECLWDLPYSGPPEASSEWCWLLWSGCLQLPPAFATLPAWGCGVEGARRIHPDPRMGLLMAKTAWHWAVTEIVYNAS